MQPSVTSNSLSSEFSVRTILSAKVIFIVGATGFLGRIMLYQLLKQIPDIKRIYLLIRSTASVDAKKRFQKEILDSPAFTVNEFDREYFIKEIANKIVVIEGDACEANFSLLPNIYQELLEQVDVVLNTAGNVDFNPPLDISLRANTEIILEILRFCERSRCKKLVHVSTCFVIDQKQYPTVSREQEVVNFYTSSDNSKNLIDPQKELDQAKAEIVSLKTQYSNGNRTATKQQRKALIELGMRRALRVCRPNCYTYTKLLAELFCQKMIRENRVEITMVRPSIVETSVRYPFPGWNEGIQGSAPLMFIVEKGHRFIPTLSKNRNNNSSKNLKAANLDCIPVDEVANGAILAMCALLRSQHKLIYQLSAGALSPPITVDTFVQVMTVSKRKQAENQAGFKSFWQRNLQPISVAQDKFQKYSTPRTFSLLKNGMDILSHLQIKNSTMQSIISHGKIETQRLYEISLAKKKIFEEFMPFIYDGYPIFDNQNTVDLWQKLNSEEREIFHFHPQQIDYLDYLSTTHVEAVRNWIFPILEKRFRVLERGHWQELQKRANVQKKTDFRIHQADDNPQKINKLRFTKNSFAVLAANKLLKQKSSDSSSASARIASTALSYLKYLDVQNLETLDNKQRNMLADHMHLLTGKRDYTHFTCANHSNRDDFKAKSQTSKKTTFFAKSEQWVNHYLPRRGIKLHRWAQKPIDVALYELQMVFYRHFMDCQILGRKNIPLNNQQVIIVANHCSHLDYGLIWYGLGKYARQMGILAAEDYFFSNYFKSTFVSNFLHLIPVDRSSNSNYDVALTTAMNFLQQAGPLLIFPEGTRSKDGVLQKFKQGLGYLVYHSGVDILPIRLSGTFASLPKGKTVPQLKSKLQMIIGEPMKNSVLMQEARSESLMRNYYFLSKFLQKKIKEL